MTDYPIGGASLITLLFDRLFKWLVKLANTSPGLFFAALGGLLALIVFFIIAYIWVIRQLLKLNKKMFRKIENKRGKSVSLQFIQAMVTLGLLIVLVVIPLGGDQIAQSLLGSTAVVAAIVGFAAQGVIKDMCAGLLISIYKPFDVGDRVEFEDGTAGIVEALTLRHVKIITLDTVRAIIPNDKANTMKVINYSNGDIPRSMILKFPVSYDTDPEEAKRVIFETVCASPNTLNVLFDPENPVNMYSRAVYFNELADSALIMAVTVYYSVAHPSEKIRDEINTAVFNALKDNNIEIPYTYINVVNAQ